MVLTQSPQVAGTVPTGVFFVSTFGEAASTTAQNISKHHSWCSIVFFGGLKCAVDAWAGRRFRNMLLYDNKRFFWLLLNRRGSVPGRSFGAVLLPLWTTKKETVRPTDT